MTAMNTIDAIDIPAFEATPLASDPYEHLVVPGFVRGEAIEGITRDFPNLPKPGLFPLSELACSGAFQGLVAEMDGPGFEAAVAEKFAVDLGGRPKLFTVRGRARAKDGCIHTDQVTKIITVLVYLNPGWEAGGGRLRVLRGPKDLSDYAVEIEPLAGTLFAFRRSDKSFHGHEPFEGERRAIQLNWMTSAKVRDREIARHRLSARLKRLLPIG